MPAAEVGNQQIVTFADFRGGEYGELGRWDAPQNSFTGRNVVVYPSGAIGPRYGLKEVSLTGISPTGVILGTGYNFAADGGGYKDTWFVIGTGVHVFDRDTGAGATAATALAASATSAISSIERGVTSYLSIPGDKMYKLDHTGPTVTALVASATVFSPGMTCLCQYGRRTMAAGAGKAPDGSASPGNLLYYSNADDPEAWAATNYLPIGDASGIVALIPQRDFLLIGKGDGSWWVLRGVPGVDDTLRRLFKGIAPGSSDHAAELGNTLVAFVVGSSSTGSIASLGHFNGSRPDFVSHLFFGEGRTGTAPTFKVVPLKEVDDWFCQGGPSNAPNAMAMLCRGIWTLHTWGVSSVTLDGWVSSFLTADAHLLSYSVGGSVPRFFRFRAYATRPAFTSDSFAQPGDASTTPFSAFFTLPEWYAPDGQEIRVASVTVDFKKYNTGSGSTNHFDLTPSALRLYQGDALAAATQSFDEAGASVGAAGSSALQRKEFHFGDQGWGNAFSLAFANLRGVAIQKIQVKLAVRPARL